MKAALRISPNSHEERSIPSNDIGRVRAVLYTLTVIADILSSSMRYWRNSKIVPFLIGESQLLENSNQVLNFVQAHSYCLDVEDLFPAIIKSATFSVLSLLRILERNVFLSNVLMRDHRPSPILWRPIVLVGRIMV